ncbi:hypothetical protein [Streptosporangium sp. NPDC051022]|uniref:hypothetical protein n=1 Tax=Streptosporangium sp. NPDC051022 TaxID=3155752 RepID=UPI003438FDBE
MIKADNPRRAARTLTTAAILLSVQLLFSGCGLVSEALRVDPAVLDDVRGIGKVLAEATTETPGQAGGPDKMTNTFVIDVGGVNAQDSLKKARGILLAHKWVSAAEEPPGGVRVKSPAWEGAYLNVRSYGSVTLGNYPEEIKKAVEAAADPEVLLIVDTEQVPA